MSNCTTNSTTEYVIAEYNIYSVKHNVEVIINEPTEYIFYFGLSQILFLITQ